MSMNGSALTGTPQDEVKEIDPFTEMGVSGLKSYGGILQEEYLKDLQGEKGRKVYREMADNDPVIGAILFAIEMLIRQVDFRVDPAEGDKPGEHSTFIEECMHDMSQSWSDTLSSILSMLPYGWVDLETVYKRRQGPEPHDPGDADDGQEPASSEYNDGRIGWRKWAIRAQDTLFRWELDPQGGIRGMWQISPPRFVPTFIPIEKSLLFRTSVVKNNPEGRSVLRNAYRPHYFKKRIEEIEGIGIERDLAGLPVIYAPSSLFDVSSRTADQTQVYNTLVEIVKNIRRDEQEGVLMPQVFDEKGNPAYKLELLTTGGRRQFDTDAIIARYDQRIAMTVLADFIMLGHERVGSFQLGQSKIELFTTALVSWLDAICGVINSHAIPRLLKLNGVPQELAPTLTHADVEEVDLKSLGMYVYQLAQAGLPIDPTDEELTAHLKQVAGLPVMQGTEQV